MHYGKGSNNIWTYEIKTDDLSIGLKELRVAGHTGKKICLEDIVPWEAISGSLGKGPKTGQIIDIPWTKVLVIFLQVRTIWKIISKYFEDDQNSRADIKSLVILGVPYLSWP